MSGSKSYPMLEVARHTKNNDCWFVIAGKVYDVTSFLDEHPGGDDILIDSAGRDATREFEDVGHSDDARAQLEGLYIGDLREPTEEEVREAEEYAKMLPPAPSQPSALTILARWLLPLTLVGLAYLIRKFTS